MKIFNIIDDFNLKLEEWVAHGNTAKVFKQHLTGKLHLQCLKFQLEFPRANWFDQASPFKPSPNSNGALFQCGPEIFNLKTGKYEPCVHHTCHDWMMRCLTFVRSQYNVEFEIGVGSYTHALYKENMTETELNLVIWPAVKAALHFEP